MLAPTIIRRRFALRLLAAVRGFALWTLTSIYTLSAAGVGVPAPSNSSSAEAYPCQHGRCGCRSAEQCWRSCCCHTDEEKLAWAAEHGVTPPAYVTAALEKSRAKRPCCAARASGCCKSTGTCGTSRGNDSGTDATRLKWISIIEAQRCRGASLVWMNVAVGLPATLEMLPLNPIERPTSLSVPPRSLYRSLAISPPEPPPRALQVKLSS